MHQTSDRSFWKVIIYGSGYSTDFKINPAFIYKACSGQKLQSKLKTSALCDGGREE